MEENNESTEFLGKMAMISEACQEVFKGKTSIAVELSEDEFINVFRISFIFLRALLQPDPKPVSYSNRDLLIFYFSLSYIITYIIQN